jgi:hypothetical protein
MPIRAMLVDIFTSLQRAFPMPVRVTVHNCTGIRAQGPGLLWVRTG